MIKNYRKKPVVIEALQFTGDNYTEVMLFVGKKLNSSRPPSAMEKSEDLPPEAYNITIPTLEGDHLAIKGDFIIKGIAGEFYPCKPEIFQQTYEEV